MDISHPFITESSQETQDLGQKLATHVMVLPKTRQATVVCLYGELGSGKTTLMQGIAKGLGLTTRLVSPTFIIMRRYELSNSWSFLYHLDLYRLTSPKQLVGLGISEIFDDASALVVIEWAERLGDVLPAKRIDVHCRVVEDGRHEFAIRTYDI